MVVGSDTASGLALVTGSEFHGAKTTGLRCQLAASFVRPPALLAITVTGSYFCGFVLLASSLLMNL